VALTWELEERSSPLRRHFEERFPRRREVAAEVRELARGVETVRPAEPVPWALVGAAVDYAIRLALDPAGAPGPALHGARLLVEAGALPADVVGELLAALPEAADEERRCRLAYALALLDGVYRGRDLDARPRSLDELLALAPGAAVADLGELSALFRERLLPLCAGAVLGPVFRGSADVGGADADLLAGGCVLDVKAVVDPGRIGKPSWPWQLLGYALLDYDDELGIDAVGLYLARQGLVVRWRLAEYAGQLAGRPVELGDERRRLRELLLGLRLVPR
jgi:hypothetical protein